MQLGELWQSQKTHEVVRIEMCHGGLLSFSILQGGQWVMCQNVWDEVEFRAKFKRMDSWVRS